MILKSASKALCLVLNLREAASHRTNMGRTVIGTQTMTTLVFALNPMLRQTPSKESVV